MNNTKWKELVNVLTNIEGYEIMVNIKLLGEATNDSFSPVWWDEVEKDGFNQIEWLKIQPISSEYNGRLVKPITKDYSNSIKMGLEKNNIPYIFSDGLFCIYG